MSWLKLSSACIPPPFPSYMMAFHSKTLAIVQATCCKQIKNKKKMGGKLFGLQSFVSPEAVLYFRSSVYKEILCTTNVFYFFFNSELERS